MTERANLTAIGAFVVGAFVLLIAGVAVLAGSSIFSEHRSFVCYFGASVKGLGVGSTVRYRGVEVGRVSSIRATFDPEGIAHEIPVTVELALDSMPGIQHRMMESAWETELRRHVDAGLRAQLALDSLVTGNLFIALEYHETPPPTFRGDGSIPEVPTIPSNLQQLVNTFQEIPFKELFNDVAGLMETLDDLAGKDLTATLASVQRTMEQVEGRLDALSTDAGLLISEARQLVATIESRAGPLSDSTRMLLDDTQSLVGKLDGRVDPLAEALQATLENLRGLTRQGDGQLARLATSAEGLMGTAEQTLGGDLLTLLAELERTARSLRGLVEALERRPEMLLGGKR